MSNRLNALDWIAFVLVIIGALNWGLVGLFGFNLVATIFIFAPIVSRILFVLVGLGGLWMIYSLTKISASQQKATERERMRAA